MSFHAPALRSTVLIVVLAALGLPATTLAQTSSSPPAELDPLAAVELMNEVPESIRASCMPTSATVSGALAATQCLHEGGLVLYIRVTDLSALEAAYDSVAAMAGVSPDTGTSCAEGAFEGEHTTADGEVAGRIVCQTGPDGPIAAWSDIDQLVLGLVQFPGDDDWTALSAAWQAAQLVEATPASGQPPSSEAPSVGPAASASATAVRRSDVSAAPSAGPESSPGAAFHQWASGATASSQYGSDTWSATQATGPTDTTEYGSRPTAWAPAAQDAGPAWLELTFDEPVIPSEVVVFESSGNGFVTSVELWDATTESWVTAWQGQDQSPEFVIGFSPDLTSNDFATDRVRVNIDTDVEGWNEIDAVALIGTPTSTAATASAAPSPGASSGPVGASPAPSAPAEAFVGALLEQWASQAAASSEYSSSDWSAAQATGPATITAYGDYADAWAPAMGDGGPAWLELTYDTAVVPSEVVVWETYGNGFVTRIQAWDDASQAWVTLWEGTDDSPPEVFGFSPPLTPVDFATDRLRIDIDTDVPEWQEVDGVALYGSVPEAP